MEASTGETSMGRATQQPDTVPGVVDALPVLAQMKMAYQWCMGDVQGAHATWHWNSKYGLGTAQILSTYECATGHFSEGHERQRHFLDGASRAVSAMPEAVPVLGHIIAASQYCAGDRKRGATTARKATRSCVVFGVGAAAVPAASAAAAMSGHAFLGGGLAVKTLAAAVSCAAGRAFDRPLFLAETSVPRPLSPGAQFDLMALCLMDMLRGLAGCQIAFVLMPDVVTEVAVYTEPLSADEIVHLATGRHMPDAWAFDSGAEHVFVKILTSKGHSYITERLSDGSIIIDGDHGQVAMAFNGGHPSYFLSQEATRAAHPALFAKFQLQANPFLSPAAGKLQAIAKAESVLPYNLLKANCQHYASDVYDLLTGAPLPNLPNDWSLMLARAVVEPGRAPLPLTSHLQATLQDVAWTVRVDGLSSLPYVALPLAGAAALPTMASAKSAEQCSQEHALS